MNGPILCLDFDGVIHSYDSGWKGAATIPDMPVPGATKAILDYLEAGFRVAVFSSRSKNIFGRWAMRRWLGDAIADHWECGGRHTLYQNVECRADAYALVKRLEWPWFKPAALVTMDDRAITFTGTWPAASELRRFKPWNKR